MSHFITGRKYVRSKICPVEKVSGCPFSSFPGKSDFFQAQLPRYTTSVKLLLTRNKINKKRPGLAH